MTLTLTLREQPVVSLEADVLRPDRLAGASRGDIEALPVWHGNERTRIGEFFAVSGAGDDVRVEGDLGGVHPGERAGMRGGEIVVHGDAGAQAGAGLRRGLIAVAGRVGEAAGLRMLAGTIVALGGLGPRAGAGMRRGSIVTMAPATPLPTFVFSCIYRPPFLRLYLRRLRALGLAVSDELLDGRYARWCGAGLELRRGEILILEEAGG